MVFENATRNPQLSLKITFHFDDAEGYNKGRFTFGKPAFVVYGWECWPILLDIISFVSIIVYLNNVSNKVVVIQPYLKHFVDLRYEIIK